MKDYEFPKDCRIWAKTFDYYLYNIFDIINKSNGGPIQWVVMLPYQTVIHEIEIKKLHKARYQEQLMKFEREQKYL